jgi:4-carboxymuconolactone decarboxylase
MASGDSQSVDSYNRCMTNPRIAPLPVDHWQAESRTILNADAPGDGALNIFATLAHHPKLMKRWLVFGNHILGKSTLSARDRELLILRTGWNCRAPYEWGQHVAIARATGITDAEIAQISVGPDDAAWSAQDADLLRAADELHLDACVSEDTWKALSARFDEQQMLDAIFTVGQYHLVSMALNSCRVVRDDGVDSTSVPFPERG